MKNLLPEINKNLGNKDITEIDYKEIKNITEITFDTIKETIKDPFGGDDDSGGETQDQTQDQTLPDGSLFVESG